MSDKVCADCPDEEPRPVPMKVTVTNQIIDSAGEAYGGKHRNWPVRTTIEKYVGDWTGEQIAAGLAGEPYEVYHDNDNLLVNVGGQRLLDLLIGAGGQAMDNTHTFMGVGNSSTAASVSQTDLQASTGSSNRQWKGMDATFPSRSGQVLTVKSTYTSGEANFAWSEWGIEIDNGTSSPGTAALSTGTQKLFNRKTFSGGTKGSGVSWVLTVTITPS